MKKEEGKKLIAERVEDFEKNKAILTKKGHGETNIRSNFIDIMYKALGWDMKSHYEVVREYSQRDKSSSGGTKKVDYAFKINGKLKFFIEAKEASVDLEKDKNAIYQAKRYAYSSNGKAPIVILTDFEEFRVFNVLKAPIIDNPDRDLLQSHCMRYTDYLEKWDLLWDTFSREAVEKGSLDKLRGKIDKNTRTMDVEFLAQITEWREILAKNIAVRNENLEVDEINEAVQRILDRLVFIRNLEDREIEPENMLFEKAHKSDNVYKSLIPLFNSLDKTYNGLLFKKHFSEEIEVDDKAIKDIIRQMCYPVSPFQFDVIEPEILGRIYEKFLGSKIRLTDSHRVKIEEKIEVRKAGGVYYTPEYIVEYIVKNTVGKKIEGLNPEEIKEIKIVDPACGSGSFLLGAYSYLLDYHQKWYLANQKDKTYQANWYKTKDGEIKVKLDKRADILRNNIFGVDIDKEATEVAIMSLYLKMLDDGFDKGQRDLFFLKGSILPDMKENIKCGNSLIGTDLFDDRFDFDSNDFKIIKPFDWNVQFFEIFSNGGFDCIIGNPPYVDVKILPDSIKKILIDKYKSASNRFDLYIPFIERSFSLINQNGIISFIMPTMFLIRDYGIGIRNVIKNKSYIKEIIHFGTNQIFENAMNYVGIFSFIKNELENTNIIKYIDCNFSPDEIAKVLNGEHVFDKKYLKYTNNKENYNNKEWHLLSKPEEKIFCTFNKYKPLVEYLEFASEGIHSGKDEVFFINDNSLFSEGIVYKLAKGKDVHRYENVDVKEFKQYVIYPYDLNTGEVISENELKNNYRLVYEYLKNSREKLKGRPYFDRSSKKWYELWCPRNPSLYIKPKIIGPEITNCGNFTLSLTPLFINNKLKSLVLKNNVNEKIEYILGLLNSKLLVYLHKLIAPPKGNNYFEVKTTILSKLPIKSIDFKDSNEKEKHDNIVLLVNQMINVKKELSLSKSEADKSINNQKIAIIDNKIDELVYELYEISDEEIKFIDS